MVNSPNFYSEESRENLEQSNIVELQAIKFAKEFSALYKSEKSKRLELEALTEELRVRNEELMDIVFLTSNQFLEPINNLESNFALIKEHENFPDIDLLRLSDEVFKSVKNLHSLVSEMGKLYRVKSARSRFRPVSLDSILTELLQDLKVTLQKNNRNIQVEPMPTLETDNVQVRILFRQLISLGMGLEESGESSVLNIRAGRNVRGEWRITFQIKGSGLLNENYVLKKSDRRKGFDREMDICQRISRGLGGYIYGERFSAESFACHVVLPEKNIPQVSCLKDQVGEY